MVEQACQEQLQSINELKKQMKSSDLLQSPMESLGFTLHQYHKNITYNSNYLPSEQGSIVEHQNPLNKSIMEKSNQTISTMMDNQVQQQQRQINERSSNQNLKNRSNTYYIGINNTESGNSNKLTLPNNDIKKQLTILP